MDKLGVVAGLGFDAALHHELARRTQIHRFILRRIA
jgi:hypothetical protein